MRPNHDTNLRKTSVSGSIKLTDYFKPLYPDLSSCKRLSVDIETHDPELKEHGPGVYRKDGHILGVALSDGKGFKEYYNFGHEDGTNEEKTANKEYIKSVLSLPCDKVF